MVIHRFDVCGTYLVLYIKAVRGESQDNGGLSNRLVAKEYNLILHLKGRIACCFAGHRFCHVSAALYVLARCECAYGERMSPRRLN